MNAFNKLDATSVVQRVIDTLISAIVSGELKAGDKIPTEVELTEQLCVSRNSIREAIKILVYLGILEIRRADGTYVCAGFSPNLLNPMVYGIILASEESYASLMELRELTEVGAVKLAIRKHTPEELTELEERLQDFKLVCGREQFDLDEIYKADVAFHDVIIKMGHNELIAGINNITNILTESRRKKAIERNTASGRRFAGYDAHKRIYELIRTRDTEAVSRVIPETFFWDEES